VLELREFRSCSQGSFGHYVYGRAFAREDDGRPISRLDGCTAKVFCTDDALKIALDSIQIHGGYGCMHDHYVEKIMRDVKALRLLGDSNPVLNSQRQTRSFIKYNGKLSGWFASPLIWRYQNDKN
jgi:alkylation response protein AidB-like acyl-CoA dehydrogenase